ncbi:MAG: hypothetical protein M3H12_15975 [Chromatiales bacterium]
MKERVTPLDAPARRMPSAAGNTPQEQRGERGADQGSLDDRPKTLSAQPLVETVFRQPGFDQPGGNQSQQQPGGSIQVEVSKIRQKVHGV